MTVLYDNAIRRIAFVSVHGCPLTTPGTGAAGGMNVFLRRAAPALAREGVEVDVFTRAHDGCAGPVIEFDDGSRVVHLPWGGDPARQRAAAAPHLPEFTDRLLRHVETFGGGYDLVHSHYWLSADPGRRLAERSGAPHVFTYHTIAEVKERAGGVPEPGIRKETEALAARQADAIVTFTAGESAVLSELYGLDPARARTVPMGVDTALFEREHPAQARRRLGIPDHERVVLFVGRVEPFKGPDILLCAAALLQGAERPRVLVVGGPAEERGADWLRGVAARCGVLDRLDWRPPVPQQELPAYYSAADVCAVPSLHESFGLAALEAMACGTPVVASDTGGLRALVRDGETGCLVDAASPDALARTLHGLLADRPRARRMGEAGAAWAKRFGWSATAAGLMRVYCSLVPAGAGCP